MNITQNWREIDFQEIVELYRSVEWYVYSNQPDDLKKAFENSSFVLVASENGKVVGALRSMSDNVSIHYLQDILVSPEFHRSGVGRKMLMMALSHYSHVRTHLLLTDDEDKQRMFYQSCGYSNIQEMNDLKLNCFIKFE